MRNAYRRRDERAGGVPVGLMIDVQAFEAGQFFRWATDKPVRRLNDGRPAVVFRGRAFAVKPHDGNSYRIDIDETAHEKNDLAFWPDEEPLFSEIGSTQEWTWSVEITKHADYIVLDGEVADVEAVVGGLARAGVDVIKSDRSWREAKDGYQYDWYIRVRRQPVDLRAITKQVLSHLDHSPSTRATNGGGHAAADGTTSAPADPAVAWGATENPAKALNAEREARAADAAAYATSLAELQDRVEHSETLREEQHQQLKLLKSELENVRQNAKQESSRLEHEVALRDAKVRLARERVEKIRAERPAPTSPGAEVTALREQVGELSRELDEYAAKLETSKKECDEHLVVWEEIEQVRKALQAANADLHYQLEETKEANKRLGDSLNNCREKSGTRHSGTDIFIGRLLSGFRRLDFTDDEESVRTIKTGFPKPSALFDVLFRLELKADLTAKPLKGKKGWWEVASIATGDPSAGNMGRIYYRTAGDRIDVSIHRKKDDSEQRLWISRLPS
jgi:hypothetical protein